VSEGGFHDLPHSDGRKRADERRADGVTAGGSTVGETLPVDTMSGGGPGPSVRSGAVIETQDATATRPESIRAGAWWTRRVPWWAILAATGLVGLPLVVAVAVLHGTSWHPVLDLAMTEFRVRDVFGRHTPLIGLPGRIGTYPAQGSHPGPLSFYLLAPTYRLLGASSWSMEVGTVVIHLVAIGTALWLAVRRLGWAGLAAGAALFALVLRGYGQDTLTQPWNPYLPLIAWVLVLLATWSVLAGDAIALVPLVVAASYCAQTHVPYLPLGVGMVVLALLAAALQWRRAEAAARRQWVRAALWAVGVGVVVWLPPIADQIRHSPGNVRTLLDHFGSPPEPAIGLGDGITIMLRHLDATALVTRHLTGTGQFVDDASAWRGAVVLVLWAIAAGVASRIGSRSLRALHVVVGVALLLGVASTARIFGRPWFYLTLWAWGTTMLALGAVLWTAVALWTRRRPGRDPRRPVAVAAAVVAVLATVASTVAFADAHHPEARLSSAVGALAGPTYDAVVAGEGAATGKDGRYIVRWSDAADIGSPGFGLLDELERRGLDVGADEYFRVQITGHRARQRADADAQIHLATGAYIDRWRAVPDAVEVAMYDPRTPAQRAEYVEVRERFIGRLATEGLDELVPLVDTNLFGISTDVRLSAADQVDLSTLIAIGQPMAVFIAPPPADDDPGAL
jgi:hypothetical protein